eukprot:7065329-Prymnesium_polylepis.1
MPTHTLHLTVQLQVCSHAPCHARHAVAIDFDIRVSMAIPIGIPLSFELFASGGACSAPR